MPRWLTTTTLLAIAALIAEAAYNLLYVYGWLS